MSLKVVPSVVSSHTRAVVGNKQRRNSALVNLLLLAAVAVISPSTCHGAMASEAGPGKKEEAVAKENFGHLQFSNDPKHGASFIDKWFEAASSYQGYVFDYQMTVFKHSGTVTEGGTLWYKKPRLLKIEELSGPKAGSVAILGKDGKVQAHGGGVWKGFTVSLSPKSHFLKSANGWPMCDSDFISLAKACQGYIKAGTTCSITSTPVKVNGHQAIALEMHKEGQIFKRALFDPDTNLPIEWWDYVDGELYAHSLWSNFRAQDIADNAFSIKGES